ncbi:hypothetical protein MTR67_002073 [Solanum verrucosum]|uniref:Uncharacterized protein n=1 Tax=Solanum verrucosum TaxID=315347 RepID=A0AAF0PPR4_SOLVR|nr:hypothetical protein MTR67_002073 [Solanum verrucosum]
MSGWVSSDGFNPFRTMSISHSTWHVMLMNYNLSPWICMMSEYIMLSMIIPGPSSLGNNIDMYLQPLIEELKELWEPGIETYDAETNQSFQMRAALMWTVSDFPALAMLSGWSTKGKLACPTCNYDTFSQYLKHSRKMCYLGHRRFLPPDHPLRKDKKSFDGKEEHRLAPTPLLGIELLEELHEFNNVFRKGIRKELQPIEDDDGNVSLAQSSFFMKPEQKRLFCTVFKNAKLPKGCASNISHRVHEKEMKISGYKSHDAHFMMYYLLQVTIRKTLPKKVSLTLISKDDPFVLASQVYQVFYVADPIEKDVYYAGNKVPVDLYDLEEENCPNIGDTFWGQPNDDIGSSTRLDEGDFRWSREVVAVDVVDILCNARHSEDTIVETSEEEDDVDETYWD